MAHRVPRSGRFRAPTLLIRAVLLLALFFSLGITTGLAPAAVGAATIMVTTTADGIDAGGEVVCDNIVIDDLAGGDGVVSLREAICAANNTDGDDIITFQAGLGSPITLTDGELEISSNLTITGPGANALTIDGNADDRIFVIDSGTVAISNLTIANGEERDSFEGGAIANYGDLTLTDVNVTNSTVTASNIVTANGGTYGGGIYNGFERTLSLVRTTISGNSAAYGGGIANFGALSATDSTIAENDAFYTGGGIASGNGFGIRSTELPADLPTTGLALTRVTVSGNGAPNGGGIGLYDYPTKVLEVTPGITTIDQSTIDGNEACVGGGIMSEFATLTITNSTISNNQATQGEYDLVPAPQQVNCYSEAPVGGGIFASGVLNLTNSTVSGNHADHEGGGLFLVGAVVGDEPVRITYATITGNSVGDMGDYARAGEPNVANGYSGGGGIYYEYQVPAATPALVAQGVTINSSIVAGNSGPAGNEDCGGTVVSTGHNLVGDETGCPADGNDDLTTDTIAAVLNSTLANNGGPTKTHALIAGSPALDVGNNETCTDIAYSLDQRGIARQSGACDIGAFELALLTLTVQTEGTGEIAVSPTPVTSTGTATNMVYEFAPGTVVTLTATPGTGFVLARWAIDGVGDPPYGKGWASPLTITLNAAHTAKGVFIGKPTFSDVPTNHPSYLAISELGARTIARGFTPDGCAEINTASPCFGPNNLTVRAESATFLTRLLNLQNENHGNGGFTDIGDQAPAVQQAIGTMAFYDIFQGYGGGLFGPNDPITHTQMILVISRAMVHQGFWTRATQDDATIYPNLTLSLDERLDLITFVQNAGNLPGFANTTPRAPVDQPAPRAWTAEALWLALDAFFGVDEPGKGGFVP